MRIKEFEVVVETVTTKSFKIKAPDANIAQIKAKEARYTDGTVIRHERIITKVKQISPRYVVEYAPDSAEYEVLDTQLGMREAKCYSKGTAEALATMLNAKEEAE